MKCHNIKDEKRRDVRVYCKDCKWWEVAISRAQQIEITFDNCIQPFNSRNPITGNLIAMRCDVKNKHCLCSDFERMK